MTMKPLAAALPLLLSGCLFSPNSAAWSGVMDALDPRSKKVLQMCAGYCEGDLAAATRYLADDAIVHVNDRDLSVADATAGYAASHAAFADVRHENVTCTTMLYNNGQVFTNYWYVWHGTARSSGEQVAVKGYAWFRWDGDHIVESYCSFDPTRYDAVLAAHEAAVK